MSRGQVVLGGLGVAAGLYGLVLLLGTPGDLRSIALWTAGMVLVGDLVVNPLLAAGGWAGARLVPRGWRPPVLAGVACTLTLLAVSVPVLTRGGFNTANPTLLDRDYPAGLAVALAVVWVAVVVSVLGRRVLAGRTARRSPVPVRRSVP